MEGGRFSRQKLAEGRVDNRQISTVSSFSLSQLQRTWWPGGIPYSGSPQLLPERENVERSNPLGWRWRDPKSNVLFKTPRWAGDSWSLKVDLTSP